jgi:urease accessory protein
MRAREVLPAGTWDAAREVDRVLLDYDHRHRRRIMLRTEHGHDLMLDLPHAAHFRQDDGLQLDDGGIVRVCARPEPLLEISAPPEALVRIAWHLGNRHLPVQFLDDRIRIHADHVIAEMARGLGARVHAVEAPFDPEAGAYAAGYDHSDHG